MVKRDLTGLLNTIRYGWPQEVTGETVMLKFSTMDELVEDFYNLAGAGFITKTKNSQKLTLTISF